MKDRRKEGDESRKVVKGGRKAMKEGGDEGWKEGRVVVKGGRGWWWCRKEGDDRIEGRKVVNVGKVGGEGRKEGDERIEGRKVRGT